MIDSLNSGVSGMLQFQEEMNVIGNNIANVNTTGYKAATVDFVDSLSQTLRYASPGTGVLSDTDAIQVGSGVATAAIKNQFTQGSPAQTGVPTDLAISGTGFFLVRDPVTNHQFATRAGDFQVDQNGYLITTGGLRVQGYSDSSLSSTGDLKIDATGAPATAAAGATVTGYTFNTAGQINVTLSDGTNFVRGQVLLQNFQDPQALVKQGASLYSNMTAAGPLATPAAPGSGSVGSVQAGSLELSNVDLATEMANLITTQRAFQSNAKIITTSDEMLQDLVNLKR